MSMRSDLGKVRGLGAAHDGTEHFWMQRVTAVANVPLVIFLIWFLISHGGASHADVVASFKSPLIAFPMALAVISVCWHMRLGLQVVIEDYVHAPGLKIASLILNNFYAFGLGAVAVFAILKMNFGA